MPNDSLAADSVRGGGSYAENRGSQPLGVSGSQSTLNNTNTSGATTLPSAPVGTKREDINRQERYPEALGGQGDFPGAHVPETGYVGGPTAAKHEHGNEYPASSKLGAAGDTYHSKYNAGAAPSYTHDMTENLGDQKPKGKNLQEGGFGSDLPNASYSSDIGSKQDPARGAEQYFQRAVPGARPAGSEARWQKGNQNEQVYGALGRDQPA